MKIRQIFPILFMMLGLTALCLTACTKEYEEDDIKKYIRDEMHISSFRILSGPVDIKGDDGYTDQEWTISTDEVGLKDDLIFHVYNDVYYSLEWTSNRLTDDLLYQKELFLLDTFDLPDGAGVKELRDSSGRPWSLYFVYPLACRDDFAGAASAAQDLQASVSSAPAFQDTEFSFSLEFEVSDPVTEAGMEGKEYSFKFSNTTAKSEISDRISALSDDYLMDCIEAGLLDRMDEYGIQERSLVIDASENNKEIRRMDQASPAYPGYAYNYYYDIPYREFRHFNPRIGLNPYVI